MLFFKFLLGACLASHAALVAERLPEQKNFIMGHSKCGNCWQELLLIDQIPLLSYLVLKGKCRFCQAYIPSDLFLAELIGGISIALIPNDQLLITATLFFFLGINALIDAKRYFLYPTLFIPTYGLTILQFIIHPVFKWMTFFLMVMILLVVGGMTKLNKLGGGDGYVILAIVMTFSIKQSTFALLISCWLTLGYLIIFSQRKAPFVPFLYLGAMCSYFCS